jgi:sugar phosphate permease
MIMAGSSKRIGYPYATAWGSVAYQTPNWPEGIRLKPPPSFLPPPDYNPYAAPQTLAPEPVPAELADELRPQSPTYARYVVLFFLCTLALVLYIDRVCIGQADKSIREDLNLTKEHMGCWIFNAFIIAYCVLEVPTGHWGDRFGSRKVITRIVVWWSAFTALTGLAFGFWPLMVIRFLFGAGEAGAFPNVARVVTRWFPERERGVARGAITTTSQIGGAIAPPLAAALIWLVDWRLTFVIFGALGVVWAIFFYRWFRDEPGEHAGVSAAELQHIGKPPQYQEEHSSIPWGQVALSPNVWLMGVIQMVGATLFYMLFQWYPTYLKEARQLSEQTSSLFTTIALSGGAIGCISGGLLSDLITRRTSERRWSRRLVGFVTLGLAGASLWCVRYTSHPLSASLLCASALFCLQLSIPTWWGVVAEISGRHGAAMFGLMNGMGGLGVMVLNALVGRIVDARVAAKIPLIDTWRPIFDGVAIALAFGAICWLLVDATRPIFRAHGEDDAPPAGSD